MAGRFRRLFREDGWLADIVWWMQSPLDLFRTERREPNRPRRRVFLDADGNLLRVEDPPVNDR